jgi:hypothetical protein
MFWNVDICSLVRDKFSKVFVVVRRSSFKSVCVWSLGAAGQIWTSYSDLCVDHHFTKSAS